ncbi:MAG: hypothetical protein FJZ58_00105 [Chlamydiae bacterium]|nr:hypothetical protein [Chlamydiota bacterium]
MPKKLLAKTSSDPFWENSSPGELLHSSSALSLNKKRNLDASFKLLSPAEETPDFHDPYSSLSLFLSHQIKEEMQKTGLVHKWTQNFQDNLLSKITPEFQKRFPQYRLGVTALKKTWEKVIFYTQQVQSRSEALDEHGKLNLSFFIRENLRQYFQQNPVSFLHPQQLAYQIASKMGECIAVIEGTKPKLHFLTKIICSLQRHLLRSCPLPTKPPSQKVELIDQLIVKTLLTITAKHPSISMEELEHTLRESLHSIQELSDLFSSEKITCNISAILAEKLYASSSFSMNFSMREKEALHCFLTKHLALYKNSSLSLPELVRRMISLYTLATQLPKDLSCSCFSSAVNYVLHKDETQRPELPQALYAFLTAELCLLKGLSSTSSEAIVQQTLFQAYQETKFLPNFTNKDLLEITLWKVLSETEGFLEKLPYRVGQRIEEEISHILIENPHKHFTSIAQETTSFFKQVQELTKNTKDLEERIHLWALQGDMLCRFLPQDTNAPLVRILQDLWQQEGPPSCHTAFVQEAVRQFLKAFPSLSIYVPQVHTKAWILYKHLWFTRFSREQESSFERFLQWHLLFLLQQEQKPDVLLQQLEALCKKTLPLLPFDPKLVLSFLPQENPCSK